HRSAGFDSPPRRELCNHCGADPHFAVQPTSSHRGCVSLRGGYIRTTGFQPRAGESLMPTANTGERSNRDRTYSITELCREFDVTPRTLRFYEQKVLLAPARRGWTRLFSYRDRARLQLILRGKKVGFSLEEIKEMLDLYNLKDGQLTQLRVASTKFR